MADIAAALCSGLKARGWQVQALETAPLSARFTVTDPVTGQDCEVDILKEIFWRPVAQSPYGPVLAEEDVIGTKVRALADRGAPRDLIDVFAASRRWTNSELEEFRRRHARGRFEREDLQANLTGAEWTDDEPDWDLQPAPMNRSATHEAPGAPARPPHTWLLISNQTGSSGCPSSDMSTAGL